MPRSTKARLSKDLVETFDPAVLEVEYVQGSAKLFMAWGERLYLNEQDLVTLLNFVRENQK